MTKNDNVISPESWKKVTQRLEDTQTTGGGSGGGMDTDVRVAVLEQIAKDTRETLKDLKTEVSTVRTNQERDFRLLFGALITAVLGLAGLMAKGFHWL